MTAKKQRKQENLEIIVEGADNDNGKILKSKREKKIKFGIILKKLKEKITLTERQQEFSTKIINNTISLASGPAGTAKTFTGCYTLLNLLLSGQIEKIILTKPIKESGESLGFLPGDIEQKTLPYMESFFHCCKEMIGDESLKFLLDQKFVECKPLAYMRGVTFDRCGMFCDEAQNCTAEQLTLYITRLGKESKMIISGDMTQTDISKKNSVFYEYIDFLKPATGVATHEFLRADIVRNPILIDITDRIDRWKEKRATA